MAVSRTWIVLLSMMLIGTVHAEDMDADVDVPDVDTVALEEDFDLFGSATDAVDSAGESAKSVYDSFSDGIEEISNTVDLYPEPKTPPVFAVDAEKSCVALDDEIVALIPLTHRTVPDFYNDPVNAAAVFLGTTGLIIDVTVRDVPIWYSFLGYTGYQKLKQEDRVRRANLRISSLRRVKAKKRCFET